MACGVRRDGARRAGFTLIEVIVSIGIIAILIGLLMPTMHEVRVKAQRVALGSQMRMHVGVVSMYATDHADTYPISSKNAVGNILRWHEAMDIGGYIIGPSDIDSVGVRTVGHARVGFSAALCYPAELMMPGRVVHVDDASSSRVRQSDVVFPTDKGVLVQYTQIVRSARRGWSWSNPASFLAPVAFLDGRVRDHYCTDFVLAHEYIEEWTGHPVLSTWYGYRGQDIVR